MNLNRDEVMDAANALLRTIGFEPEEVKELHISPGPEITIVHYIRHPGGHLETVSRHVKLKDAACRSHKWVSMRVVCQRGDPQVCARCGAKRVVTSPATPTP